MLKNIAALTNIEDTKDAIANQFLINTKILSFTNKDLPCTTRDVTLAFYTQNQDQLISSVIANEEEIDWPKLKRFGIPLWLKDTIKLKQLLEHVVKNEFKNLDTRDDLERVHHVCLWYLAMNKKQIALALYKKDKNGAKIYDLMSKDFTQDRWKSAASKNAYVLLSKKKYMLCASFFLLGKNIKDCVNVLIDYLHDIQLAVLVCRLVEGEKSENLKRIYTDYFIKKGEEIDDPYLRLFGYWNTEQYIMALNTLCINKNVQKDLNEEIYKSELKKPENAIWTFDTPRTCKLDYSLYILSKKLVNSYNVKNALEASKPKQAENSIFDDFFDNSTSNATTTVATPSIALEYDANYVLLKSAKEFTANNYSFIALLIIKNCKDLLKKGIKYQQNLNQSLKMHKIC